MCVCVGRGGSGIQYLYIGESGEHVEGESGDLVNFEGGEGSV